MDIRARLAREGGSQSSNSRQGTGGSQSNSSSQVPSSSGSSPATSRQSPPRSRAIPGRNRVSTFVNPFAARSDLENPLTVGDSVMLLEEIHNMLGNFTSIITAQLVDIRERQDQLKDLLVPIISFGENSPYNADANKAAKSLLAQFIFFPTDAQLIEAAPSSFRTMMDVESCRSLYRKYVSLREIRD